MKVATIIGTRPEIIRLSRVMAALDRHFEHIIIHTGQNYDYELNEIFFKQLEIRKPDYFMDSAGKSAAETIGNVIAKADSLLSKEKPDALLVLGDTNSCLAVISAKRLKIPIFHMEAGNRCFDLRVPEEINRKIVDHTSDINLTYSEHARRYLMAEGIRPETIIVTGSPMREVLEYYRDKIDASDIVERMKLDIGKYFVVSAHREENIESETNFNDLIETLNALSESYGMPIIVSTHPRTRKRLENLPEAVKLDQRINFLKPLGFLDYVRLQMGAFCVLSDSGTITEESSILDFPAVTIRQAHERPEGMDEGVLIMCGLKKDRVVEAVKIVTDQVTGNKRLFRMVSDYRSKNVSEKVVRIIPSYTDYVNRIVWQKAL
ncbi:MAG: UDP-N-acetylglucosamine 2-epimerase (non-hydrolyzing) [Phycisphaerales bacterium]|nr:MAG: UDP-N-acetylglucosamine 2-epimerase (non-hydrolyzing) [Phycisphaerales bacterium]